MRYLHGVSALALSVALGSGAALAQSQSNINGANLLNPFTTLGSTPAGIADLTSNLGTAISVNNGSSALQRQRALIDNTITSENGVVVSDGLGTSLNRIYSAVNSQAANGTTVTSSNNVRDLFRQVNGLSQSDSGFAKNFFANGSTNGFPTNTPAVGITLPPGGRYNVYDTAYMPSAATANRTGDSRPFQVRPASIQAFAGTDYFGAPTSNTAIQAGLSANASSPSGHTTFGYTTAILFALMVPERYQQLLTRASEYGDSRIVLGVHYPLDIIMGRTLATYDIVQALNNNPAYTSQTISVFAVGNVTTTNDFTALLGSATGDLRTLLTQGCGTAIATCAASGTADRFSDLTLDRANYLYRLTYGLPAVGATNLAPVVPVGAEVLLASRFPYLSADQRREVLATTEIASGGPLDTTDPRFAGYSRLDLFAAAGGYGAFNTTVTVNMDSSLGGFNALDTWSNDISGPGGLIKNGTGILRLSGTDTYTGGTTINGGALFIDGSIANSLVTINNGGLLGGNGRIGALAVNAGGVLSPGNSIGTLSVSGSATFAPGSVYVVEANAAGQADRTLVGGSATIQGGTVQVLAANGTYNPRTSYNILNATGGVTGRFSNVNSNLAFLNPYLTYDPTNVTLTLVRNDVPFAGVAQTRNDASTAAAVQSLGFGQRVYDAVSLLDAPGARGAFGQLSGEIHASGITAEFETGYMVREAVLDRLRGSYGLYEGGLPGAAPNMVLPGAYSADLPGRRSTLAPIPVGPTLDPRVVSVWGQGFGSFGSTHSDGNAATLRRDTAGFIAGVDASIDGTYRFGIAGGYTDISLDVRSRGSTGDITSGFGSIYGGANFGPVAVRLGGVFAGNSADIRRNIGFAGFSDTLRGQYGGTTIQGFGELGYKVDLGTVILEPFVGGATTSISRDRFTERGGAAALTVFARDYDVQTLTAGIRGEMAFGPDSPFSLKGLVGYRRAFGDVVPTALLAFAGGGTSFSVAGIPIDRDAFVAEAGIGWKISPVTTLSLSYTGQIGSRAEDHGIKGSFVYRF